MSGDGQADQPLLDRNSVDHRVSVGSSHFSLEDESHSESGMEHGTPTPKCVSLRNNIAFFFLGNVTDFIYIIFILAAQDMLKGTNIPTAASLLADTLPGTLLKTVFPWCMTEIPYPIRVLLQVLLSCGALLLAALGESVGLKLFAIVLGSLSCGIGEITYLALTARYDRGVMAWYSSGLGSSGPIGGASYLFLSLVLKLEDKYTLLLLAPVPLLLLLAYFSLSRPSDAVAPGAEPGAKKGRLSVKERLTAFYLSVPYFGALFVVFFTEYVSLNGVVTTIAFRDSGISKSAHYMVYMYTYAISVWISRTSISCFRIPYLWPQSGLQALTLAVLLAQSFLRFIPSVYIVFGITLWMGLLGGSVFANAFYAMSRNLPERYREFALGLGTGADSLGIALAGVVNMWLEPALVDYCKSHYPDVGSVGYCTTRS